MTIKPPAWVATQGGIPTEKGWKHPNRNEILLNKKFTQAEIDEYLGTTTAPASQPDPVNEADEWMAEDVNQDGIIDELESMTKVQLEELGRNHGVELDRRKTRSTLISQMREILSNN